MPQITDLNMKVDPETRPYVPWELVGNFMVDVFKKVAAGDMAVEPADDAEDATSATLPSFMPADPERRLG